MSTTIFPKWLPIEPRKRRWLASALFLILAGLLVALFTVPAVLLHRYYDENISRLSRQVNTQSAFNAMRPRLTESLELLKKRDVKKLFLKGSSPALALAELQELVRSTIETNGGRVAGSSAPGSAPKEEGVFRPVVATFTLNSTNSNVRRVLHALETREPYLFIDSVVIQPQVGSTWRPPPGSPEPDMFVQLDVRGFALRTASEQTSPASAQSSSDATSVTFPTTAKARNPDAAPKDKRGAP